MTTVRPDDGEQIPQRAGDGCGHHGLDDVDIVGDTGHEHAGLFLVKKGQGQALDLLVEPVAQLHDNFLAHITHQILLTVHASSPQQVDHYHGQGMIIEQFIVFVNENIIHHGFDQKGGSRSGSGHHQHADHAAGQLETLVFDQA